MSLLKTLASMFVPSARGSLSEPAKLAALLIAELRLYNEEAVAASQRDGVLSQAIAADLERAYTMFLERAGKSEEAREAFRVEATRQIVPENPEALRSLLSRLEQQLPPRVRPR